MILFLKHMEITMKHFQWTLADWCLRYFGAKWDTPDLIEVAQRLGCHLDLVAHQLWQQVQAAGVGLSCVLPDMGVRGPNDEPMPPFEPGFGNLEHHDRVHAAISAAIDRAADAGIRYVLVFTGYDNRDPRKTQYDRIVDAYTKPKGSAPESLLAKAESRGVILVLEMLNTEGEGPMKGHEGYLGNDLDELVEHVIYEIDSPNFLLALDFYHVAMMYGDPIEAIERYHDVIGIVHIAGKQGKPDAHDPLNRGEILLEGQEIDYPPIFAKMAELLSPETFVLIEYIPTTDDPALIENDLAATIEHCESQIAKS